MKNIRLMDLMEMNIRTQKWRIVNSTEIPHEVLRMLPTGTIRLKTGNYVSGYWHSSLGKLVVIMTPNGHRVMMTYDNMYASNKVDDMLNDIEANRGNISK